MGYTVFKGPTNSSPFDLDLSVPLGSFRLEFELCQNPMDRKGCVLLSSCAKADKNIVLAGVSVD